MGGVFGWLSRGYREVAFIVSARNWVAAIYATAVAVEAENATA